MGSIQFKAVLQVSGSWSIIRLPEHASLRLPSRSVVFVLGTANGISFSEVLEPDGEGRHWFRPQARLLEEAGMTDGAPTLFELRPSEEWPEPETPADLGKSLEELQAAADQWADITPLARREWIRWIGSTANPETRRRRIEAACGKLSSGERRPCCFNRNLCAVPEISKSGKLTGFN